MWSDNVSSHYGWYKVDDNIKFFYPRGWKEFAPYKQGSIFLNTLFIPLIFDTLCSLSQFEWTLSHFCFYALHVYSLVLDIVDWAFNVISKTTNFIVNYICEVWWSIWCFKKKLCIFVFWIATPSLGLLQLSQSLLGQEKEKWAWLP